MDEDTPCEKEEVAQRVLAVEEPNVTDRLSFASYVERVTGSGRMSSPGRLSSNGRISGLGRMSGRISVTPDSHTQGSFQLGTPDIMLGAVDECAPSLESELDILGGGEYAEAKERKPEPEMKLHSLASRHSSGETSEAKSDVRNSIGRASQGRASFSSDRVSSQSTKEPGPANGFNEPGARGAEARPPSIHDVLAAQDSDDILPASSDGSPPRTSFPRWLHEPRPKHQPQPKPTRSSAASSSTRSDLEQLAAFEDDLLPPPSNPLRAHGFLA